MSLGEKVRYYRELNHVSISDLAKEIAIPENIIIRIENSPDYTNTPHGRLQAKKILEYFGAGDNYPENIEENLKSLSENSLQKLKFNKYLIHVGILLTLFLFIYANAVYNKEKVEVSHKQNIYSNNITDAQSQDTVSHIKSITLKSSGDVWITATIDGEKVIFNIKDGETKTIDFQNKIAFETIGNVHQLTIQFGEQEVSFKDKEVIHNVFVDEEGVFYNGYNVLRGKPKI